MKKICFLILLSGVVSACESLDSVKLGLISYTNGNRVCSALIGAPDQNATTVKTTAPKCPIAIFGRNSLRDISIQPADPELSALLAVSTVFTSPELGAKFFEDSEGSLAVYRHGSAKSMFVLGDENLKLLIDPNGRRIYARCFMSVSNLNWKSKNELLMRIKPACANESIPQDVELVLNTDTKKRVGNPTFLGSNDVSSLDWSSHASKRVYSLEISNGKVFVNGKEVDGLISGVIKSEAAWVLRQ